MRGNTVNNMKLMIIAKIRETCTRFLQPTRSECKMWTLLRKKHVRTCFGETGLKIRPDVFRHDICEQFFEALYLNYFFIFLQKRKGR